VNRTGILEPLTSFAAGVTCPNPRPRRLNQSVASFTEAVPCDDPRGEESEQCQDNC
jgi:hypothetical protein